MTPPLHIMAVPPAEWPTLAPFIFEQNRIDGDVRCVHSHGGLDASAYAEELRSLPSDEGSFVAAYADDVLVGVAGAEIDIALGRAWLRGPLVAAGLDFQYVGAALLQALRTHLPAAIVRHDAFVTEACTEALTFLRGQGFGGESAIDEYSAASPVPGAEPPPGVRLVPAERRWREVIGRLHEGEFPGAYVTADGLFAPDAPDVLTRVALVEGEPAGYVRVHFDPQWQQGYVDFLAVLPAFRGRRAGRALLEEAMRWSFAQPGTSAVTLTVRQDRLAARTLYESAGFRRVRSCIGLRRSEPGRS